MAAIGFVAGDIEADPCNRFARVQAIYVNQKACGL